MSQDVTGQLDLPRRHPFFRGSGGDIFAEHGHRFDRSNHDNITARDGPRAANWAYYMPVLRAAEPIGRAITSIGHPSEMLDCYLLGATLVHLYQRYDLQVNPFSIYVMGHSHNRQLFEFNIRADYQLYEVP